MVKVQNGWERRSLDELESSIPASSAPAQLNSYRTPSTPTPVRRTPHHVPRLSTSSAVGGGYTSSVTPTTYAHSPDGYPAHSPSSQPALFRRTTSSSSGDDGPAGNSPRTYASFWANHTSSTVPATGPVGRHAHKTSTSTVGSTAPSLAPAADLTSPTSKRRSYHGRAPPTLGNANYGNTTNGQLMSPQTPRRNLLRMPSQQAEKDAVDTLLFMSSPNNSSTTKYAAHASPLRDAFAANVGR